MDEQVLRRWVSRWPGVSEDMKWGDDLVFSVAGKMFCVLCETAVGPGKLSFKVESERFLEFTDRPGFCPAPYLARAHWVMLEDLRVIPHAELESLLRRAYELVRAKLPKKTQHELAQREHPA